MKAPFVIIVFSLINFVSCTWLNSDYVSEDSGLDTASENLFVTIPTPTPDEKTQLIETKNSPIVLPSTIIEDLRKKSEKFSDRKLVYYANKLLKTKGYNFAFSWEPKGKENLDTLTLMDGVKLYPLSYTFKDLQNNYRKIYFATRDLEHPCFSHVYIPITKVNQKVFTTIADGKPIELQRPKDFYLEEIVLVDQSLKKEIRKWFVPIDSTPLGISADGKKIYFEFDFSQNEYEKTLQISDLAFELSEDGDLQFVLRNDPNIIKGEELKGFPNVGEVSYRLFKDDKRKYTVRFSYPCT